ncbi:MAG: DNA alkylation repair protein [Phycisphaeraceae bacterium]|nr:DNA alkylation repair protein [Phycisphaerales bacterium]QOJ16743.1 MAG: DNA alkylation repair protein [Phycisphaeraceae bacterium]
MNLQQTLAKLESLGDEKRRAHNARTGPDGVPGAPPDKQFGCATGDIRALAKKIKSNHALALELWKTGNLDAQLLAILLMKPKELAAADLDRMVREARFNWVADWFSAYILKEQPDDVKEALRQKWMKAPRKDGWAARAGWNLTASRINKAGAANPGAKSKASRDQGKVSRDREGADAGDNGLDLEALLDRIEKEMPAAPPETKWAMNNTLGAIGIHHAKLRKRAIAIGEKIGLYKDWPMSKGCTIPYVPVWVAEMVKRQG